MRIEGAELIEYYRYDGAGRVADLGRYLKNDSIRTDISARQEKLGLGESWTFSYQYNDANMITSMTYPDASTHYFDYDELARLKKIRESETEEFVSGITYLKSGVVSSMEWKNGVSQTWQFDNRKRTKHIGIYGPGGNPIEELSYSVNGVGNIEAINDNEYRYDAFNQIVYAKTSREEEGKLDTVSLIEQLFGAEKNEPDPDFPFEYDPRADLNKDERIDGADHALSTWADSSGLWDTEEFSYDKNGNRTQLKQNGDIYRYEYGTCQHQSKITGFPRSYFAGSAQN